MDAPCSWKMGTYASILPAVVGPNDPDGMPSGFLAGPA